MKAEREYKKLVFNGEVHITRGDVGKRAIREAKKLTGGKDGYYYLDNGKVTFYQKVILGKWKCEGTFYDRKATKMTSYSKWIRTMRRKEREKNAAIRRNKSRS